MNILPVHRSVRRQGPVCCMSFFTIFVTYALCRSIRGHAVRQAGPIKQISIIWAVAERQSSKLLLLRRLCWNILTPTPPFPLASIVQVLIHFGPLPQFLFFFARAQVRASQCTATFLGDTVVASYSSIYENIDKSRLWKQ